MSDELDLMEDGRAAVLTPNTIDGLMVDKVFMDGKEVRECVHVNRRKGLVRFHVLKDGKPVIEDDAVKIGEARGDVIVTWKGSKA